MTDVITRLKLESGEYDSRIKRATQGLLQMEQECRRVNGTLSVLEKDQLQYVQSLGKMQTVSTTVRGKLNELTQAYTELSVQYKRLTDEEKKSDFGKALSKSLDQIKTRINDTKQQLAEVSDELGGKATGKFGQFGGIIDSLGSKLGITGNLTEMLTSKTALMTAGIGAAGAAVAKSTQMWAKYNAELAKQDQVTQITTELTGPDATKMTDQMRALSDTYGVEFRDAINAANTLMTQFGMSGDEATRLIKDGMRGMILGDGPKLLQMIQQYAPSFRDAGISASQLVAIIHNSEGGIFTDENMNAIVMGIKNIRLMTKATSDALGKLGIDGEDMTRKLNDGSITIFDAMKQVVGVIKDAGTSSQGVGEVMQYVFGRQGAAAGTNLAKAIDTLNLNLDETKRKTGEVGDAYADLQTANENLNTAIRDAFGYDGWEQMATGIKSKLVGALASVIDKLGDIRKLLSGMSVGQMQSDTKNGGGVAIDRMISMLGTGKTKKSQRTYQAQIDQYTKKIFRINDQIAEYERKAGEDMEGNSALIYQRKIRDLERQRDAVRANMNEYDRRAQALMSGTTTTTGGKTIKPITKDDDKDKTTSKPDTQEQKNQKEINRLVEEYKQLRQNGLAIDDKRVVKIQTEISRLQELNAQLKKFGEEALSVKVDVDADSLPGLEKQLKDLQEQQKMSKSTEDYIRLGKEIDAISDKIATFKGELPKNKVVDKTKTFSEEGISAFITQQEKIRKESAIGSDEYNTADTQIIDAKNIQTLVHESVQAGLDMNLELSGLYKQITDGYDVNGEWQPVVDQINAKLKEIGADPIKLNVDTGEIVKTGKDTTNAWKGVAGVIGNAATALSSLKDPELNAAGIVAQAIANIALGFASAAASPATAGGGVFGWIAAAVAGLSTMVATISTIHSSTGFAQGGIVPGNNLSGDNLDGPSFGINSGELILNKAQQGNLASQLEGSGLQNMRLSAEISGEQIRLVLNNNGKRTGRGEYLTTKFH